MIAVQFAVVLAAIFLGARLGGIAIGFAGGLGVLVLALLGLTPGEMPLDVVSIIMSVIAAIAAMQVAGGMDYLVDLADRILRKNPKYLTFLAPVITYLMTLMAGTGHTAFSTMPVITEVAKENNIRRWPSSPHRLPSRPRRSRLLWSSSPARWRRRGSTTCRSSLWPFPRRSSPAWRPRPS